VVRDTLIPIGLTGVTTRAILILAAGKEDAAEDIFWPATELVWLTLLLVVEAVANRLRHDLTVSFLTIGRPVAPGALATILATVGPCRTGHTARVTA
jgi:hypothetical protein